MCCDRHIRATLRMNIHAAMGAQFAGTWERVVLRHTLEELAGTLESMQCRPVHQDQMCPSMTERIMCVQEKNQWPNKTNEEKCEKSIKSEET